MAASFILATQHNADRLVAVLRTYLIVSHTPFTRTRNPFASR